MAGDDRIFEGDRWWKRFKAAFNSRQGIDYYEMMRRLSRAYVWPRRRWPTQVDEVYVDGALGVDDYSADGRGTTAALPYATIEAALREAIPGRRLTIWCAAGSEYAYSDADTSARCNIYLRAQEPEDDADGVVTGTTIEVTPGAYNVQSVYEVAASGVAADEWRGAVVKWSDGVYGLVYANEAESGGAVRFSATQDRFAGPASRDGLGVTIYPPGSLAVLRFTGEGNPSIRQASRVWIEGFRLRPDVDGANRALVVSDQASVRLLRCVMLDEWQRVAVFDFGVMHLRGCYLACSRSDDRFGFVSISGLGRVSVFQGTVWDGTTATPSEAAPWKSLSAGAGGGGFNIGQSCHVWRGMNAANLDQEVCRLLGVHDTRSSILMLDCIGPAHTFNSYRNHARGVSCEVPTFVGNTSASYGYTARQARIRLAPDSAVVSALGTNVVACEDRDGVFYRVARDDRNGTLIEGGDVAPQWPGSVNVETLAADKVLGWGDAESHRLDAGGSGRNVDLPGTNSASAGSEYLPLGAGRFWIANTGGSGDLTVRWSDDGTPTTVATLQPGDGAWFLVTEAVAASRVWTHSGIVTTVADS